VPAAEAVTWEELAPARPWQGQDVLEIGRGGGGGADDGRVERPSSGREERKQREPRPDLEPP